MPLRYGIYDSGRMCNRMRMSLVMCKYADVRISPGSYATKPLLLRASAGRLVLLQKVNPCGKGVFVGSADRNFFIELLHDQVRALNSGDLVYVQNK